MRMGRIHVRGAPPQVLPDYRNEFSLSGGASVAKQQLERRKQRVDLELRAFFAPEKEDSERLRKECAVVKKDNNKVANRHFIDALDNALHGGGLAAGLAHYLPRVRVGALRSGETRYFIEVEDSSGVASNRSCIKGGGDRATRYEVPKVIAGGEVQRRPTLHCCLDQGIAIARGLASIPGASSRCSPPPALVRLPQQLEVGHVTI